MARPPARGVGADRDPRHGHDRLDVIVGHAIDDDRHVQPVVDQRIERDVRRFGIERLPELGERATGPVRVARCV